MYREDDINLSPECFISLFEVVINICIMTHSKGIQRDAKSLQLISSYKPSALSLMLTSQNLMLASIKVYS